MSKFYKSILSLKTNKNNEFIFGFLAILLAMCCLALSGILVKVSTLGPATTGFYRIFLAFPFIFALTYISNFKQSKPKISNETNNSFTFKYQLLAIIAGIIFGSDMVVWNKSLSYTSVAASTLLGNMSPLFTIPLTALLFKEKIHKLFLASVLISIIGLILLFNASLSINHKPFAYLGNLMAFFTAFTYAVFLTIIASCRKHLKTTTVTIYSASGALFSLIIIALITESNFLPHSLHELFILLMLGFLVQFLGQSGLIYGLKKIPINLVAILVLIEPLLASIIAYYLFNEHLGVVEIIGGILILYGIYLANKQYFKS
ncbi:DMT family transporter [Rickettsiales bacterium LUAb2]